MKKDIYGGSKVLILGEWRMKRLQFDAELEKKYENVDLKEERKVGIFGIGNGLMD